MHINYDDSVDYEEAVEMFLNLHPTKLVINYICYIVLHYTIFYFVKNFDCFAPLLKVNWRCS